jgi:hypothetical protein
MQLAEKCYRAMAKLDEIAMFIGDYNDIYKEYVAESKQHSGKTTYLAVASTVLTEKSEISTGTSIAKESKDTM